MLKAAPLQSITVCYTDALANPVPAFDGYFSSSLRVWYATGDDVTFIT